MGNIVLFISFFLYRSFYIVLFISFFLYRSFSFSFLYLFVIYLAAFVVAAGNSRRCRRCFSGRSGSDKPFKIARYAIYDDAIIAVRINTNDKGINNNYNNNSIKARVTVEGEASDEWTWGRGCQQQRLTDGRCVLFEMLPVNC